MSWLSETWDSVVEVAEDVGNKALIVKEGVVNSIAGIPAIPGYVADLADLGVEKLGGNLYDGSAGAWIQDQAKTGLDLVDPLKWAGVNPQIRNESDLAWMQGSELATDGLITIVSLGAGGVKLAGTVSKFAVAAARSSDDIARLALKGSDDVVVAAGAGNITTTVAAANATVQGGNNMKALKWIHNWFSNASSRYWTVAAPAAITAAGVTYNVAESGTGGAVSEAVIRGAAEEMIERVKNGELDATTLNSAISNIGAVVDAVNSVDTSAQNGLVLGAMGLSDNPSQEQIAAGKSAAVLFQLRNPLVIGLKNAVRSEAAKELFKNSETGEVDQAKVDEYLARGFVTDLIEGSKVNALSDHPVTEEDMKTILKKMMEEQPSLTNAALNGSVGRGLRQMWPDLFTGPAAEAPGVTPEQQAQRFDKLNLADQFNIASQYNSSGMWVLLAGLSKALEQVIGDWGLTKFFQEKAVDDVRTTISQSGDRLGLVDKVPIPGENRPDIAPVPSPVS